MEPIHSSFSFSFLATSYFLYQLQYDKGIEASFQNLSECFKMFQNGFRMKKRKSRKEVLKSIPGTVEYRRRPAHGSRMAKKVRAAAKHVHWYRYRYQTFSYSFSFLEPPFWNHSETFWNVLKRSEKFWKLASVPLSYHTRHNPDGSLSGFCSAAHGGVICWPIIASNTSS